MANKNSTIIAASGCTALLASIAVDAPLEVARAAEEFSLESVLVRACSFRHGKQKLNHYCSEWMLSFANLRTFRRLLSCAPPATVSLLWPLPVSQVDFVCAHAPVPPFDLQFLMCMCNDQCK